MFKLGLRELYSAKEVITIGDIHAGFSKLQRLWNNLGTISPDTHVVFAGDLLDRGTDVFEVLDFIIDLKQKYPGQIFIVEGNHDRFLRDYLYPEKIITDLGPWAIASNNKMWVEKHGGFQTVEAFKLRYQSESHIDWRNALIKDGYWQIFEDMIPYYESETLFISHAPLDGFHLWLNRFTGDEEREEFASKLLGVADYLERKLRNKFTEEVHLKIHDFDEFDLGKTFICGHQSSYKPEPRVFGNRVFLDVSNYNELYAYSSKTKKLISSKSEIDS